LEIFFFFLSLGKEIKTLVTQNSIQIHHQQKQKEKKEKRLLKHMATISVLPEKVQEKLVAVFRLGLSFGLGGIACSCATVGS